MSEPAANQDVVFADSQIGKGLKPLAQHGSVVVGTDGTFTLLGTKGDVIDSAPITEVTAKRLVITGGQTVTVKVQDRKYNVSPGWGNQGWNGVLGVANAAKALVKIVEADGKH
jgi:hypothetical protein